jgi:hypothetical protein
VTNDLDYIGYLLLETADSSNDREGLLKGLDNLLHVLMDRH